MVFPLITRGFGLWLVFFFCQPLAGQESKSDSLSAALSRYEKSQQNRAVGLQDSTKSNILFALARLHVSNNPNKAYGYAQQQLALSEKIGYVRGTANALNLLGSLADQRGDYQQAESFYLRAGKLFEKLGGYQQLVDINNNIGVLYLGKGIYAEGLKYLLKALEIAREHHDEVGCLTTYNNLGMLYRNQKQDNLALNCYFKALKMQLASKERFAISYTYLNIAEMYRKTQPKKAMKFGLLGLESAKAEGDSISIANNYAVIGNVEIENRNFTQALESHEKALAIRTAIHDAFGVFSSYVMLAEIYQKTGQNAQALHYSLMARTLLEGRDDPFRTETVEKQLSTIRAAMGDYKGAYQNLLQYNKWHDSVFNLEVDKKLTEQRLNFDFKAKEREKDARTKAALIEQRNIRNWIAAGLTLAALSVILILVARHRRKNRTLRTELERKATEANSLRVENENIQLRNDVLILEQGNQAKENQILEEKLAWKQRELTSSALYLYQKNELLSQLKKEVDELPVGEKSERVRSIIHQNLFVDADWERFRLHFEQVHPEFFKKLEQKHPNLTTYETRLSAYMEMKLSTKEIAALLNIEPTSVHKAKMRLNKKLHPETS